MMVSYVVSNVDFYTTRYYYAVSMLCDGSNFICIYIPHHVYVQV